MTDAHKRLLKWYFETGLFDWGVAQALNVPSFRLQLSCYLFCVSFVLNGPVRDQAAFRSSLSFRAIPTHWDIRKMKQGDEAWRFNKVVDLGGIRFLEKDVIAVRRRGEYVWKARQAAN